MWADMRHGSKDSHIEMNEKDQIIAGVNWMLIFAIGTSCFDLCYSTLK